MRKALSLLIFTLAVSHAQARVLDDFDDGVKTGWAEFRTGAGGGITENFGLLTVDVPAGLARRPVFTATARANERLVVTPGATLELRVDIASVTGSNAFAVLAWVPDSRPLADFAGYFIAKSANELRVGKAIHKYFMNETPGAPVKNDNVTLTLANVLPTSRRQTGSRTAGRMLQTGHTLPTAARRCRDRR